MSPSLPHISVLAAGLVLAATAAAPAAAQAINTNPASFNAGYGRVPGQEFRGVQIGSQDGNRLIVDGIIQSGGGAGGGSGSGMGSGAGFGGASASATGSAGASASASGAASGGASAIGNNLTVVTNGNYNVVIVNSTQVNNGAVTANTIVSGK